MNLEESKIINWSGTSNAISCRKQNEKFNYDGCKDSLAASRWTAGDINNERVICWLNTSEAQWQKTKQRLEIELIGALEQKKFKI